MLLLWIVLCIIGAGFCYYIWPQEQRTLISVVLASALMGAIVLLFHFVGLAVPVKRTEIVTKVVKLKYQKPPPVIYKDRIVYKVPGADVAPINPDDVCKGKIPAELLTLNLSSSGNETSTWVIVRPVGSQVKVTCSISGDLSNFWKVGDIMQFKKGETQ